jgi:hypothetical protein
MSRRKLKATTCLCTRRARSPGSLSRVDRSSPDARRELLRVGLRPIREFFRALVGAFQGRLWQKPVKLVGADAILIRKVTCERAFGRRRVNRTLRDERFGIR